MQTLISTPTLLDFARCLERGTEAFLEAGRILVMLLEDDPDVFSKITDQFPKISRATLVAFERIGRGQLHPEVALSDAPAAKHLARCSFSEQKEALENGIDLLIVRENQTDTLRVKIGALQPRQVAQVFAADHIRDIAEQRVYFENQRAKRINHQDLSPYKVQGGSVVFRQGTRMTKRDLIKLLHLLK